jgi:hypothetical protein
VEYSEFEPVAAGIIGERVFKPFRGQTPDEERVKELIPQLESKLDAYDGILGRQKYLAGDVRLFRLIVRDTCEERLRMLMMDFVVHRRSPSRISSICLMAAWSLNILDWGIWRSVQMCRGKRCLVLRPESGCSGLLMVIVVDGGKTSHPGPRGRP